MPGNSGHVEGGEWGRGGGEQEILTTGLTKGSTGSAPAEKPSSARQAFSVAVDELEESLGEESLRARDFFVEGEVAFSWSADADTRFRRAFSLARLGMGRQTNSGSETMKVTCSGTRPGGGRDARVSTRRGDEAGDGAYLDCAGRHLELGGEFFAEHGVGFGVFAEDVFEDLELVSRGPLAVFHFVGDVREESPEIDRRGVDSGGHQGRNASTGIPWLGDGIWVHVEVDRGRDVGEMGVRGGGEMVDGEQGVGRVSGRLGRHGRACPRVGLIVHSARVRKTNGQPTWCVHTDVQAER